MTDASDAPPNGDPEHPAPLKVDRIDPVPYDVLTVRSSLQRIGNSQGVVIPKPLLAQLGIEHAVEMRVVDDHLEVRKAGHPRDGWGDAISALPAEAFSLSDEDRAWLSFPDADADEELL